MTRLKQGRLVQFIDRETGGWNIGHEMEERPGEADVLFGNPVFRLVRTTPAGELVIVTEDQLSPYPALPIPEPTNTGRKD